MNNDINGFPCKNIINLPKDLIFEIFSYLDISSILCSNICKYINAIILTHEPNPIFKFIDLSYLGRKLKDSHIMQLFCKERLHLNQKINLRNCISITDNSLFSIGKMCYNLKVLNMQKCGNITDNGLKLIGYGCPNLSELNLSWCGYKITDVGTVSILKSCKNLNVMELARCEAITDATAYAMSSFGLNLTIVNIKKCKLITQDGLNSIIHCCKNITCLEACYISDRFGDGIFNNDIIVDKNIKEPSKLEVLEVSGSLLSSKGIKFICNYCINLKYLRLDYCPLVKDESLQYIGYGIPNLEGITLKSCLSITNEGLKELSKCTKLHTVEIAECFQISDNGVMSLLSKCQLLVRLNLSLTRITDDLFKSMINLVKKRNKDFNILVIHLQSTNITDFGLLLLTCCSPDLKFIDLENVCITDYAMTYISRNCRKLNAIDLRKCWKITNISLEELSRNCRNLQSIDLSECQNLTDDGISILSEGCPKLKCINLYRCLISDNAVISLCTNCLSIKDLGLTLCVRITNSSMIALSRFSKHLELLFIECIVDITDEGVIHLLNCKNMKQIWLNGSGVTQYGINKLRKNSIHVLTE